MTYSPLFWSVRFPEFPSLPCKMAKDFLQKHAYQKVKKDTISAPVHKRQTGGYGGLYGGRQKNSATTVLY